MEVYLDYKETTINRYKTEIDMKMFSKKYPNKTFKEILEEKYNNNIWDMANSENFIKYYPELPEILDYIDTDFYDIDIIYN